MEFNHETTTSKNLQTASQQPSKGPSVKRLAFHMVAPIPPPPKKKKKKRAQRNWPSLPGKERSWIKPDPETSRGAPASPLSALSAFSAFSALAAAKMLSSSASSGAKERTVAGPGSIIAVGQKKKKGTQNGLVKGTTDFLPVVLLFKIVTHTQLSTSIRSSGTNASHPAKLFLDLF